MEVVKQKQALFIINGTYPNSSAISHRVDAILKLLKMSGFSTFIISHGPGNNDIEESIRGSIIGYYHYHQTIHNWIDNHHNYLYGASILNKILPNLLDKYDFNLVIVSGGYGKITKVLMKYFGINKGVPLIVEVCEWYDLSQIPFGIFSPLYWDYYHGLTKTYKKVDGILAISHFFSNYYSECNVLYLPVIFSAFPQEIDFAKANSTDYLDIVYSGFPGKKKDLLDNIVTAILNDNSLLSRIRMHIVGVSEQIVMSLLGSKYRRKLIQNSNTFKFYGRVSKNRSREIVANCDFSIIIRPNKRYALAGFPTKFAESMILGVPVIANPIGEPSFYLEDGVNGLTVNSTKSSDISVALHRAIAYSSSDLNNMKTNAKRAGLKHFIASEYSLDFMDFLRKSGVNI